MLAIVDNPTLEYLLCTYSDVLLDDLWFGKDSDHNQRDALADGTVEECKAASPAVKREYGNESAEHVRDIVDTREQLGQELGELSGGKNIRSVDGDLQEYEWKAKNRFNNNEIIERSPI